ncbi:unnamed protein product [Linum trigynum]|uniref:Uncharacterized protein n=1 Tax=Linum trigynum TaxID=586398 RepID=A0AAV2FR15_9ROSI
MAASIVRASLNKFSWFVVLAMALHHHICSEAIAQQVPCFFIFGDSLMDNGNNHQLKTVARADYPPYGIDFPGGPSGRFCNGRTPADVLAELLGFDHYMPPFTVASGLEVLKGVNYASAAAGIREDSGEELGGRIPFGGQVENYKKTVSQIETLLGDEVTAAKHLSKCIHSVLMGNNDYINNYFLPEFFSTAQQFTPVQYADDLIRRYNKQLKVMYSYGARKFALQGLGQIGCAPFKLDGPNGTACVQNINDAVQIFNRKLKLLVDQLNQDTPDAKFIYLDTYGIFKELLDNPVPKGFTMTNEACCGVGKNNALLTCLPFQTPCENRNQYLFWDSFHTTDAANEYVSRRSYRAESPSDAHPYDISRLAQV